MRAERERDIVRMGGWRWGRGGGREDWGDLWRGKGDGEGVRMGGMGMGEGEEGERGLGGKDWREKK